MQMDTGKLSINKVGDMIDTKETYGLEPVLTVDEVASFLRMDRKSVYSAVAEGALPARKVGRRVVILRDSLLTWLRSNCACHQLES